jgi:alpha-glucoside transport system permease protein
VAGTVTPLSSKVPTTSREEIQQMDDMPREGGTTTLERMPPEAEPRVPGGALGIGILRLLAAVALPIIGFFALWYAFDFLRDTRANRGLVVLVAILVGVGGIWLLYWGMDSLTSVLPLGAREKIRPFVFVGPALFFLSLYLVYPAIKTIVLSFQDARGETFVGLDNYAYIFTNTAMLRSIRNSLGWIVIVPAVSVSVGLLFATMADRLRRTEAFAKSLIFLPLAISFVGASIVWGFMYSFRPAGFGAQVGVLNGILVALGRDPVAWLRDPPMNSLLLMVIMIWMQTGFAMVILSAAIKGVPTDLIEAARIDGATELQIFWRIIIPTVMSTIVVVTTTMVITVLKVFDIVWVMTGGQQGTEVIAERMVRTYFRDGNFGRAGAIAVMLLVMIIPVLLLNVRRFRAEEAIR